MRSNSRANLSLSPPPVMKKEEQQRQQEREKSLHREAAAAFAIACSPAAPVAFWLSIVKHRHAMILQMASAATDFARRMLFLGRRPNTTSCEHFAMNEQQQQPQQQQQQQQHDCDMDKDSNNTHSSNSSKDELSDLFRKFCASSTIHGTYFWSESRSAAVKMTWGLIVLLGIGSATFIINSSFEGWRANPIITSVMQKSIEEIPFPAITVCPMEDTRFGYVEKRLNSLDPSSFNLPEILLHLLHLLHQQRPPPFHSDCLLSACITLIDRKADALDEEEEKAREECSKGCPSTRDFYDFLQHVNATADYQGYIRTAVDMLVVEDNRQKRGATINQCKKELQANCSLFVRDFRFLQDAKMLLPKSAQDKLMKKTKPGTLLKMLHSLLEERPEEQEEMFRRFLPNDTHPEAYACNGTLPLPDLVSLLSNWGWKDIPEKRENMDKYSTCNYSKDTLLDIMRNSLHPPHLLDETDGQLVPSPAFPICSFSNHKGLGSKLSSYPNTTFCDAFQTIFNDHGLCYTYNNVKLGLDNFKEDDFFTIRKVTGCGKERGFQLVVDNHRLTQLRGNNNNNRRHNRGFKVFITVPGVVTSKVPFNIDPSFEGEHSFFLHGIHHIRTTKAFRDWNRDAKICNFPTDRNLSLFSHYSQDNCLLECRLRKVSASCGCSPWYFKQEELGICGPKGNRCLEDMLAEYKDELLDRKECHCLNDCEMVHLFSTLSRESYEVLKDVSRERWFDPSGTQGGHGTRGGKTAGTRGTPGSGLLYNYLLDPEHALIDELSKKLLMLANNVTDYKKVAKKRFRENVAVLNFFFDTPIITQINLELKTNIFDMISAVGGTLGLFTGISVITFVEIFYWLFRFALEALKKRKLYFWPASSSSSSARSDRSDYVYRGDDGRKNDSLF